MISMAVEQDTHPVSSQRAPQDLYRLLVLRNSGSEILVASERSPFTLPCVEIPRWERVAENVTQAARKRCGISAICLFTIEPSDATPDSECPLYQVMETRGAGAVLPSEMRWLPLHSISDQSFADEQDLAAINNTLCQIAGFQSGERIGPFGRPGWIEELFSWVEREIQPYGLHLTGNVRQLNASPTFSLIRLETNAQAVWFKAVGEPNLREFSISITLAKLFPGFVPTVIAGHPAWHGWLTTEFPGSTLDNGPEACGWELASRTLAELQILSVSRTDELLEAGCKDIRTGSLLSLVDPFVEVMSELMTQQRKSPPPVICEPELRTLGRQIKEALYELSDLGIPDSLGHLDFNPGNILSASDRCVFCDWVEAYVGFPFFTSQYLHEHVLRRRPSDSNLAFKVAKVYETTWGNRVTPRVIAAARDLAPVLAVFAYAAGTPDWSSPAIFREHESASYLRALTRRMQLEMQQLQERRRI